MPARPTAALAARSHEIRDASGGDQEDVAVILWPS